MIKILLWPLLFLFGFQCSIVFCRTIIFPIKFLSLSSKLDSSGIQKNWNFYWAESQKYIEFESAIKSKGRGSNFIWPYSNIYLESLESLKKSSNNTYIQPSICQMDNEIFVIIEKGIISSGLLVDIEIGRLLIKPQSTLKKRVSDSLIRLKTQLRSKKNSTDNNKLIFSISLQKNLDTPRNGNDLCFNLELASQLIKKVNIVGIIGKSYLKHLAKVISRPDSTSYLKKPHYNLILNWNRNTSIKIVTSSGQLSSTINGQPLPFMKPIFSISLKKDGKQPLKLGSEWNSFLAEENSRLDPSKNAKIIYKKGSWVYIDKGRGFGFKINDRIKGIGSLRIYGHIVSYYGANLSMKDNKKKPISDGAIVFVRSGLSQVKIGDEIKLDDEVFPTP